MELNEYINKLFAAAKEAGFEACECRYSTDKNMEISVFSGEIDEYSLGESALACAVCTTAAWAAPPRACWTKRPLAGWSKAPKSSAELIGNDDKEFLFPGSDHYAEVDGFSTEVEDRARKR